MWVTSGDHLHVDDPTKFSEGLEIFESTEVCGKKSEKEEQKTILKEEGGKKHRSKETRGEISNQKKIEGKKAEEEKNKKNITPKGR